MSIKIHFYIALVLAYMYATHKLEYFLIFYLFTFIHELAHILVVVILKEQIVEIIFLPFGINAKYKNIHNSKKEILIASAGPLTSLLLAGILKNTIYCYMNLIIFIFNILPMYPLDGGKILKGILVGKHGYKKGIEKLTKISKTFITLLCIISIIGAVYVKNYYFLILTIYIAIIMDKSLKKERIKTVISELVSSQ